MDFYKSMKFMTLLGMIIVFLLILLMNYQIVNITEEELKSLYYIYLIDIKNILYGIFVGLAFSFLFSIQTIRSFLLKSVSNFMTDDAYLTKLEKNELQSIKDKASNIIHGIDIVSNEQSLFNYIKKQDDFLSTPHKSIVNEFWTFEYWEDDISLFKTTRVQEFRVHTLDLEQHNKFEIVYRYVLNIHNDNNLQKIKDHFNLTIKVNGDNFSLNSLNDDENNILVKNSYDETTKRYEVYVKKQIKLKEEYTKIHIETSRIEEIDDSMAIVSRDATYGMNYVINFPDDISINNVYYQDMLYVEEKDRQASISKKKNSVSININGWHLPGMIFALTYKKDS